MRPQFTIIVALVMNAAMLGEAYATAMTNNERNAITDKELDSMASIVVDDPPTAKKLCEEARAIAARFDIDDWAQGHVDGCFAEVAEASKNTAGACKLRDSQIAHYKRVAAAGSDELKKNIVAGLRTAKEMRAAFGCK